MSVALLYVIVIEEIDSGNTFPSFLHSYAGGRCGLNFAMQFNVTDTLGEAGKEAPSSLLTKRKGTWTEKDTQQCQCNYSVTRCTVPTCTEFFCQFLTTFRWLPLKLNYSRNRSRERERETWPPHFCVKFYFRFQHFPVRGYLCLLNIVSNFMDTQAILSYEANILMKSHTSNKSIKL